MTKVDPLYIAQLIIYTILLQPILYCLIKHGRHGLLGWLYLQSFCTIRIVAAALIIHQKSSSGLAATIIGSTGLSPLLLCAAGILHEARTYRNPRTNRRVAWFLTIQYHALVAVAMVMVILAVVKLIPPQKSTPSHSTSTLLKIGLALLILAWVLLVVWTALSFLSRDADKSAPGYTDGTRLFHATAIALPLIFIRLLYAAISLSLDLSDPRAGFLTSRPAKILMSVVMEILVTAGLVGVGVWTREVKRLYTRVDSQGWKSGSGSRGEGSGVEMM